MGSTLTLKVKNLEQIKFADRYFYTTQQGNDVAIRRKYRAFINQVTDLLQETVEDQKAVTEDASQKFIACEQKYCEPKKTTSPDEPLTFREGMLEIDYHAELEKIGDERMEKMIEIGKRTVTFTPERNAFSFFVHNVWNVSAMKQIKQVQGQAPQLNYSEGLGDDELDAVFCQHFPDLIPQEDNPTTHDEQVNTVEVDDRINAAESVASDNGSQLPDTAVEVAEESSQQGGGETV